MKPKIGECRYVETISGRLVPVTIASRETYNHREFYRVIENIGLFLSKSLKKVTE